MRGFLYVYQKEITNHNPKQVTSVVDDLKQTKHQFNFKENDKLKLYHYTNEGNIIYNTIDNSKFISLIGQFVENEESIRTSLSKLSGIELKNYVSDLKGAFALAIADINTNEITFFTHVFRIDNIFYRETDRQVVVGTDPLIVSAISNENGYEPEIEIHNSVSFLMNGYFADEKTLFKDVKLVPPNSEMKISNNKITVSDIDNTFEDILSVKPNKDLNNMIMQSYIDSFKAIPVNTELKIGVTGGKDSRLALLGALEAGYKVKPHTRGSIENPDVQIAQQITETLGLEHKVTEPKISEEQGITVNLEKKVLDTMIATSGQVYGYENIKYRPTYKGDVGLTGVAALTMKGGYSNLNKFKNSNPKKEMLRRFLPLDDLIVNGASEDYKKSIDRLTTDDFQESQYKHALFYRNGRWTSASRLAKSYSSDIYSPYYDNYFTKLIIKVKKQLLDNGFIQYTLTNKLNSKISKFPLVGSRWGFEVDQPVKPENYNSWLKRAPKYAKTKLANYNWKNITIKENEVVRNQFKEILLSNPDHKIYEVIDYDSFKNLFDTGLKSKHLKFIWAALSLFSYINYLENKPLVSNEIKITVPEAIKKDVNSVPQTIDLTGELLSINDSLRLSVNTSGTTVSINENVDKNRYLTLFSKSITTGSQHPLAAVTDCNNITFNTFIESTEKINFNYNILFFSEKNKIKTEQFKGQINRYSNNLRAKVNVPKEATNFKIAIRVPKNIINPFKIRYLFVTTE